MSVEALLWAYQQPVSPSERFVLLTIGFMADPDGYAWPGIPYLAKRTGLSTRGVQTILRRLESGKFIEREPRRSVKGDPDTNLYRLPELARGGEVRAGGAAHAPVQRVHEGGASGAPVIERLVKDKVNAVSTARAKEPVLEGDVPEWLGVLRQAKDYDLSATKESALIRTVSTLNLPPNRVMSAAEALIAKWPMKGYSRIDMVLRSWLRRDGNGNGTTQTNNEVLGKTESRLTPAPASLPGWEALHAQRKAVDAARSPNGSAGLLHVPPGPTAEPRGKAAGG